VLGFIPFTFIFFALVTFPHTPGMLKQPSKALSLPLFSIISGFIRLNCLLGSVSMTINCIGNPICGADSPIPFGFALCIVSNIATIKSLILLSILFIDFAFFLKIGLPYFIISIKSS